VRPLGSFNRNRSNSKSNTDLMISGTAGGGTSSSSHQPRQKKQTTIARPGTAGYSKTGMLPARAGAAKKQDKETFGFEDYQVSGV
jgi:hypothetical protein